VDINYNNCIEPLDVKDLYRSVSNYYQKIMTEGFAIKKKHLWTNPNLKINRRKVANRENGKLKIARLIAGVTIVVRELMPVGMKVTQRSIAEHSHGRIKLDRIKRNWKTIKNILEIMKVPIVNDVKQLPTRNRHPLIHGDHATA
jgi:hypothetical protein